MRKEMLSDSLRCFFFGPSVSDIDHILKNSLGQNENDKKEIIRSPCLAKNHSGLSEAEINLNSFDKDEAHEKRDVRVHKPYLSENPRKFGETHKKHHILTKGRKNEPNEASYEMNLPAVNDGAKASGIDQATGYHNFSTMYFGEATSPLSDFPNAILFHYPPAFMQRLARLWHHFSHVPFLIKDLELFLGITTLALANDTLSILVLPLKALFFRSSIERRDVICLVLCFIGVMTLVLLSQKEPLYAYLYHMIRRTSIVKLVGLYNILDMLDKLLSSFSIDSIDILDACYMTAHSKRVYHKVFEDTHKESSLNKGDTMNSSLNMDSHVSQQKDYLQLFKNFHLYFTSIFPFFYMIKTYFEAKKCQEKSLNASEVMLNGKEINSDRACFPGDRRPDNYVDSRKVDMTVDFSSFASEDVLSHMNHPEKVDDSIIPQWLYHQESLPLTHISSKANTFLGKNENLLSSSYDESNIAHYPGNDYNSNRRKRCDFSEDDDNVRFRSPRFLPVNQANRKDSSRLVFSSDDNMHHYKAKTPPKNRLSAEWKAHSRTNHTSETCSHKHSDKTKQALYPPVNSKDRNKDENKTQISFDQPKSSTLSSRFDSPLNLSFEDSLLSFRDDAERVKLTPLDHWPQDNPQDIYTEKKCDSKIHQKLEFRPWAQQIAIGEYSLALLIGSSIGAIVSMLLHVLILLLLAVCLDVAISDTGSSLFPMVVSLSFTKLKSVNTKKYTPESLFQVLCADAVERFQYFFLIFVLSLQHFQHGWKSAFRLFELCLIIGSEFVCNLVKHLFMARFNGIPLTVYPAYYWLSMLDIGADQLLWRFPLIKVQCTDNPAANVEMATQHLMASRGVFSKISKRLGFVSVHYAVLIIWATLPLITNAIFNCVGVIFFVGILILLLRIVGLEFLRGLAYRFFVRSLLTEPPALEIYEETKNKLLTSELSASISQYSNNSSLSLSSSNLYDKCIDDPLLSFPIAKKSNDIDNFKYQILFSNSIANIRKYGLAYHLIQLIKNILLILFQWLTKGLKGAFHMIYFPYQYGRTLISSYYRCYSLESMDVNHHDLVTADHASALTEKRSYIEKTLTGVTTSTYLNKSVNEEHIPFRTKLSHADSRSFVKKDNIFHTPDFSSPKNPFSQSVEPLFKILPDSSEKHSTSLIRNRVGLINNLASPLFAESIQQGSFAYRFLRKKSLFFSKPTSSPFNLLPSQSKSVNNPSPHSMIGNTSVISGFSLSDNKEKKHFHNRESENNSAQHGGHESINSTKINLNTMNTIYPTLLLPHFLCTLLLVERFDLQIGKSKPAG